MENLLSRKLIFLNRKEYNEWVDDSYLLIGKARFYKQEYNEADAVLNYSITQANDPDIRKEASIWLARIYNEKARYTESYRLLSELEINDESSALSAGQCIIQLLPICYIKAKEICRSH